MSCCCTYHRSYYASSTHLGCQVPACGRKIGCSCWRGSPYPTPHSDYPSCLDYSFGCHPMSYCYEFHCLLYWCFSPPKSIVATCGRHPPPWSSCAGLTCTRYGRQLWWCWGSHSCWSREIAGLPEGMNLYRHAIEQEKFTNACIDLAMIRPIVYCCRTFPLLGWCRRDRSGTAGRPRRRVLGFLIVF